MKAHNGDILPIDSLPQTCIYEPNNDSFYQFYDVDERCQCGSCAWFKDKIARKLSGCEYDLPHSIIYRCEQCKEVRLARLKKKYEKISSLSNVIIETLRDKFKIDNSELFDIIENTYAKLGVSLYGEKFIDNLNQFNQI